MGAIVSSLTTSIDVVANDIAKLVTDSGNAVDNLARIAKNITAPPVNGPTQFMTTGLILSFDSGDDVPSALKSTMKALRKAAENTFTNKFPDTDMAGSEFGVVKGYKENAALDCVIAQMKQDFSNWQVPVDQKTIGNMAKTIALEVNAQMGAAGLTHGHHNLNLNQEIDWVVSYGLFVIDADKNEQGLVYAFAAGFSTDIG